MRGCAYALMSLAVVALLGSACGGGSSSSAPDVGTTFRDTVASDATTGDDMASPDSEASEDVGEPVTPLDLDFQVAYARTGRIENENKGESDLYLLDPADGSAASVTNFLEGEAGDEWSCANSCIIDDALQWIAVADGPRGDSGFFSFGMGRFTEEGVVQMAKASPLQDVVDLHFSDTWVYYSRLIDGSGLYRQYEIWRAELASPANREKLMDFPPTDALDGSSYAGHFRVNPTTDQVLLLVPTIRSVSLYLWEDGRLGQLDFICPVMRNGQCAGTGSEYSDREPSAFSRDGRYIAVFIAGENELRLLLYDLEGEGTTSYFKDLARVDYDVIYDQHYCEYLETWQYGEIVGQPVFDPAGESLYFVGMRDCGTKKPETDILELAVERLKAFETLGAGDIRNVTQFPTTGASDQVVVNNFDISPAGDVLVFTGTPQWGQNDELISEGSSRHESDSELWIIGTDGTRIEQLTEELRWAASSPHAVP